MCCDRTNTATTSKRRLTLIILGLMFGAASAYAQSGENVDVCAEIDHKPFERLLIKYVNEQGLVNYGAWKQVAADLSALDNYLNQFAAKIESPAQGNEKAPSLVNAYNAFVLRWITRKAMIDRLDIVSSQSKFVAA
jgi:hypothetical protein